MNEEIINKVAAESKRSPEFDEHRGLMEAVFRMSLENLRDFAPKSPEELNGDSRAYYGKEREARSSWKWMEIEDLDNPFSFVNICEAFGYDIRRIREMTYDLLRNNGTLSYFLNRKNEKERVA